jgi:hypothetical protein
MDIAMSQSKSHVVDKGLRKLVNKELLRKNDESVFAGVDRLLEEQLLKKMEEVRTKFDVQLSEKLIELLTARGIDARFDNIQEWMKRITRVRCSTVEHYYEYYLDYYELKAYKGRKSWTGILLITTNEEIKVDYGDNTGQVKITIG